jgi:hypothetical protein
MGCKKLEEIVDERDLGVIVSSNFKVSKQCIKAARKKKSDIGID